MVTFEFVKSWSCRMIQIEYQPRGSHQQYGSYIINSKIVPIQGQIIINTSRKNFLLLCNFAREKSEFLLSSSFNFKLSSLMLDFASFLFSYMDMSRFRFSTSSSSLSSSSSSFSNLLLNGRRNAYSMRVAHPI